MSRTELDQIPDQYLAANDGTSRLRHWLDGAGRTMTLQELDHERHHRGIRPPSRPGGRRDGR